MSTPEPYQPCPCGSGAKYKFCCRSKGRFKEPPVVDDLAPEPEVGFDPPPRFGIADAMGAYAQPLVDRTDGTPEQVEKAMMIAMLCWNMAILPDEEHDEFLADMREPFQMDEETFRAFRREVIDPMILRHREMFPGMSGRRTSILRNAEPRG